MNPDWTASALSSPLPTAPDGESALAGHQVILYIAILIAMTCSLKYFAERCL